MVAKTATKIRGVKTKPNHQKSPPKGTLENSRVSLGKMVIKIRKKTPCLSQKLVIPNGISDDFINMVAAPVNARKRIIILNNFLIIVAWN